MSSADAGGSPSGFATTLLAWYDAHGRHDLPWQHPRTPYRVWVSEVMLQQTRVQTVLGYFERFLARFPELPALAAAPEDDVLALWSGLGYYRRARHLHHAARLCVERHGGELPDRLDALAALPGIGRSTAAAILAQAHGQRVAILDGNVKRVLARLTGEAGWPGQPAVERRLWAEAEARLPQQRIADYTQALMDFGATLCTPRRPRCGDCPVQAGCHAFATGRVALLPTRKPAKPMPTRRARMLVLRDAQGRVLLERREGKAVWQGLWSLPEAADAAGAEDLRAALGAGPGRSLPAFDHAFSHYRLEVQASLHAVREPVPPGMEAAAAGMPAGAGAPAAGTPADAGTRAAERRWVARTDYDSLGLPRPIRRLLESLP
jgi:A/G-specific adenine glycosylase